MARLSWIVVLIGVATQAAHAARVNDDTQPKEAQTEMWEFKEKYMQNWPLKRSVFDVVNWPLPSTSLLGVVGLDPRRRRELREGLEDFREFRMRLSQSEEHTFAKLCTAATGTPHQVSCGDTMECFMYFFFSYHHFGSLMSGPTTKQADAALALHGDTGREVKLMYERNDWNGIMSAFTHREVVRSFSRVPLEELQATLLREDRETELPRMFALYLQWNILSHDVFMHVGTDEILKKILAWGLEQIKSEADEQQMKKKNRHLWDLLFQYPSGVQMILQAMFPYWRSDTVAALRQLVDKPATPATIFLKGVGLPFDLSLDRVNQFCNHSFSFVSVKYPPEGGKMRPFSEACAHVLQVGSNNTWTYEEHKLQNHIFAIVKRHNHDFSIVQGYIGEHGYDLSGWARSKNKFASPKGFDGASMRHFLRHLSTFVENGAGGTFNGDNHYATFDHFERDFNGKSYRPLFGFSEALATDVKDSSGSLVRDKLIKPLIEEMDHCNCTTVEWPLHQNKNNASRNIHFSTWMFLLGSVALAIRLFA